MPTLRGEKRSGSTRMRWSSKGLVYEEDWDFLVEVENKFIDRMEVYATPGLPRVNQTTRGPAVCKSVDPTRREEQPILYDVAVSFSSEIEEGQGPTNPAQPEDPTTWVPVRETIFEKVQELMWTDVEGVPIANSAGDPFETAPFTNYNMLIWEFWQFEPLSVTDEILVERNNLVNESVYKTKPPFTMLLEVGKSTLGFYYGIRCRLTQYFIKFNDRTWKLKIPDIGAHYTPFNTTDYIPFLDDSGNPKLGNLNGLGGKAADGDLPYILEFDQYQRSDFAFLRI